MNKIITAGGTSSGTFTFNLSTDNIQDYNNLVWTWTQTQGPTGISIAKPSTSFALNNSNSSVTLTISNIPYDYIGPIFGNLVVNDTIIFDTASIPFTVTVTSPSFPQYSFCSGGSNSTDLTLSVDVKNNAEVGDQDTWYPLDIIEADVKFENDKDSSGQDTYNLQDVILKAALYKTSSTSDVIDDMIWISEDAEEFNYGDVDEGKKAEHTFKFKVNPEEFDQSDNYYLMIKAYGDDSNNNEACIDFSNDLINDFDDSAYYADVTIKPQTSNSEMIVVDEDTLTKDATASCEQQVSFTADIWNIGDDDFADKIMVTLYNDALGIDQNVTVEGDLDAATKTTADFTFTIPEGMDEKQYDLEMQTFYDYDSVNDEYDRSSNRMFTFPLTLSGNCILPKASIAATLEEGGQAGKPLVVRAAVTNTGLENSTYTFSVASYSDWASSATINNTLTLAPGESQDIFVTLDVDRKTVAGDYTFNIESYSSGKHVLTQSIQVAIEDKEGLFANGGLALPILIAVVSALAIAIIIILIVRASRKK